MAGTGLEVDTGVKEGVGAEGTGLEVDTGVKEGAGAEGKGLEMEVALPPICFREISFLRWRFFKKSKEEKYDGLYEQLSTGRMDPILKSEISSAVMDSRTGKKFSELGRIACLDFISATGVAASGYQDRHPVGSGCIGCILRIGHGNQRPAKAIFKKVQEASNNNRRGACELKQAALQLLADLYPYLVDEGNLALSDGELRTDLQKAVYTFCVKPHGKPLEPRELNNGWLHDVADPNQQIFARIYTQAIYKWAVCGGGLLRQREESPKALSPVSASSSMEFSPEPRQPLLEETDERKTDGLELVPRHDGSQARADDLKYGGGK